jgi:ferredoxin
MGRVFFPQFRRGRDGVEAREETILEHARRAGVEIASDCGGRGECRKCVVNVESGEEHLLPRTSGEAEAGLQQGERLACQARVRDTSGTVRVVIRAFGRYSILTDGQELAVAPEPFVER